MEQSIKGLNLLYELSLELYNHLHNPKKYLNSERVISLADQLPVKNNSVWEQFKFFLKKSLERFWHHRSALPATYWGDATTETEKLRQKISLSFFQAVPKDKLLPLDNKFIRRKK